MTDFSGLVGSDEMKDRIGRAIRGGRLSHAYLIEGPDGSGKRTFATMIAAAANCTGDKSGALPCGECPSCKKILSQKSADVHYIGKGDKASVSVEAIRDLRREMSLSAVEADTRVFIVEDADTMTPAAENALLISLEEPPAGVLILLLAESADGLLPTIRSRVQTLRMGYVQPDEMREHLLAVSPEARKLSASSPEKLEAVISASHGRIGGALDYLTPKNEAALLKERETVSAILSAATEGKEYAQVYRAIFALPQKKRTELTPCLAQLREGIRDLVLLRRSETVPLLFFTDRKEALRLADRTDYARLLRIYDLVIEAERAVAQNGNISMILTSLAVGIGSRG